MTIASAITAAQGRVVDAYTAISNKGGMLPATQNLANMPTAINSIPTGGGSNIVPTYQIVSGALTPVTNTYALTGSEFSGVSSISDYALAYRFYNSTGITGSIDLSDLVTIGEHGMFYAFDTSGISGSVDLSKLTTVGAYGLYYAFYNTNISGSIDLSKLTTLNGSNYHLGYAFSYTSITSVDLSGLTELKQSSLTNAFLNTLITNIDVSNITTAGTNAFNGALSLTPITVFRCTKLSNIAASNVFSSCFSSCRLITDIYFNALTTTSFGSYVNQFNNMFNSLTASTSGNVNVHLPSNLQSTIAGLTGYPLFGGTSGRVTLLFDLAATS